MRLLTSNFSRTHLPYCLHKVNELEYVPLNRLYKPLGVTSTEWIEYKDHFSMLTLKEPLTPDQIMNISCKAPVESDGHIFLYDDEHPPLQYPFPYFAQLQALTEAFQPQWRGE